MKGGCDIENIADQSFGHNFHSLDSPKWNGVVGRALDIRDQGLFLSLLDFVVGETLLSKRLVLHIDRD
jgi:hypothetical protein